MRSLAVDVAYLLASQAFSQFVLNRFKMSFRRARPIEWLMRAEPGHSFPSGHAATAVVFYGAGAVLIPHTTLPQPFRIALPAALVIWACGIGWSRLELGAHYLTDVLGGFLFGAGWVCASLALCEHAGIQLR